MCGIFSLLNCENDLTSSFIIEQFNKGKHRGPESSTFKQIMIKNIFGFHRLAINGLDSESDQPIVVGNIRVICNGEIYNYKELFEKINVKPVTNSDCEIIAHLYLKYGFEYTLSLLDGVFALCLLDYSITGNSKMYVARDPFGIRPMYMLSSSSKKNKIIGFASELKQLSDICLQLNNNLNEKYNDAYSIQQFMPGTYNSYELVSVSHPVYNTIYKDTWKNNISFKTFFHFPFLSNMNYSFPQSFYIQNISRYLQLAVNKRCSTTDRPIACLLSGGLDSSLITALVNEYHKSYNLPTLETYSIGLENAEDLQHARTVADYLGTKHTEIIMSEQQFIDAIPNVIKDIESFDTTTVRASIGNWLIGKYISENSQAKVVFNGDGSDELTGGYLYMGCAGDSLEFDKECKRLLKDIYMFDVLRSDKCISSHGLEPRTPFLDKEFVQYYLSIPYDIRFHTLHNECEKFLLRSAFDEKSFLNLEGKPLLPNSTLWRRKEAFSDGVSNMKRSLFTIIEEHSSSFFKTLYEKETDNSYIIDLNDYQNAAYKFSLVKSNSHDMLPKNAEQFYYRKLFEDYYHNQSSILPYFWMPKYVEANDSSARTLKIYSNKNDENTQQNTET